MTAPRRIGPFEFWFALPLEFGFWRCESGPFRWFAFVGPLVLWRLR